LQTTFRLVGLEFAVRGTLVTVTKGIAILLLVGLAFVTYGGYDYVQQSGAVDDAVSVEATIEKTSISEVGRRGVDYDVQIEFTYQYHGTEYTSDQLYPGSISETYDTRSEAQSVIDSDCCESLPPYQIKLFGRRRETPRSVTWAEK